MIGKYILTFLLSLLITYILIPFVKKIALVIGALDYPNSRRVNKKPVPNIGGIAIYLGFIVSVLLMAPGKLITGILLGGTFILVIGVIDDLYEISPLWKLSGQIIAAVILLFSGVQIEFITNPFGGMIYLGYWGIPLTILWIVSITNTVNLIDGLDGLAAGVSVIAVFTLFFVSIQEGQMTSAILALALAGSALAFLKYNFHPAQIFMGDSGAMFLGYTLAAISVAGALKSAAAVTLIVPVLALGVPIFDTVFAIIRRVYNSKPIAEADKGHIHHRLLALGWSQSESVLIVYGISIFLGLMALVINGTTWEKGITILGLIMISLGYGAWRLGIFNVELSSEGRTAEERQGLS
jgi:UDP-GlcNAc:undecaprenyl-phosphate GlcNAc-1-phosphate transferase